MTSQPMTRRQRREAERAAEQARAAAQANAGFGRSAQQAGAPPSRVGAPSPQAQPQVPSAPTAQARPSAPAPLTRRERRLAAQASAASAGVAGPADSASDPASHDTAPRRSAQTTYAPFSAIVTGVDPTADQGTADQEAQPRRSRRRSRKDRQRQAASAASGPDQPVPMALAPDAPGPEPVSDTRARHQRQDSLPTKEVPQLTALAHGQDEETGSRSRARRGPRSREDEAHPAMHPSRRGHAASVSVGRGGVLLLLTVCTVLAPVAAHTRFDGSTAVAMAAEPQPEAVATQGPSSVAAPLLGSDADWDDSAGDSEISNEPDAATKARIREAAENARATCAKAEGASGERAAFQTKPELFIPMVAGTYHKSSPYGYRIHPTLGILKLHSGSDYTAPVGTPIYAVAAGTVVTAGMEGSTGTITIKHEIDGKVWYTRYMHMYSEGIYVHPGDTVTPGQLIAGVGSTGRSTGPHLHFEVRTSDDYDDGSAVDPDAWLAEHGAAEPAECNN